MRKQQGRYRYRAKILNEFFGVYGQGNFDISLEELAIILRLVEEEKSEELGRFYERLYNLRMGSSS